MFRRATTVYSKSSTQFVYVFAVDGRDGGAMTDRNIELKQWDGVSVRLHRDDVYAVQKQMEWFVLCVMLYTETQTKRVLAKHDCAMTTALSEYRCCYCFSCRHRHHRFTEQCNSPLRCHTTFDINTAEALITSLSLSFTRRFNGLRNGFFSSVCCNVLCTSHSILSRNHLILVFIFKNTISMSISRCFLF